MARFGKAHLKSTDLNGFDSGRTLQVVGVGGKAVVYLIEGAGLAVEVANDAVDAARTIVEVEEVDAGKLSTTEKKSNLRKLILRGVEAGATRVKAGGGTVPLKVVVVSNGSSRVFDGTNTSLPPPLVSSLKGYGLRGAALRVAEDQMNSQVARSGLGAGMYGLGKDGDSNWYDWCGGFAHWCYQTAARLIGETNPFGNTPWTLASPQRAISWAMAHPDLATVIRYSGANPMAADNNMYGTKGTRRETQELVDMEVAGHGNPSNVIEGDICLFRNNAGGWKHVSIVYATFGTDTFDTIDGNQGNPSIKIKRGHKFGDKVGQVYRHTFLHLSLPPVDWIGGWSAEAGTTL